MRTAIHEAGHTLAARHMGMEVYKVTIDDETGYTQFRGRPFSPDWNLWTSLAGPAAERHFFGEADDNLDAFGAHGDLIAADHLHYLEYEDWDDRIAQWAEANADMIEITAGRILAGEFA